MSSTIGLSKSPGLQFCIVGKVWVCKNKPLYRKTDLTCMVTNLTNALRNVILQNRGKPACG
uniref:Uncharacterized protein n=1 Tax=Arundo donax TaxID=35708 RepID=A0A0A9HLG9_ARUDO